MDNTKIQWTDATWNIARGCTKVDADCKFCYMYREGDRYKFDAMVVQQTKTVFRAPLRWKDPRKIFVSSLTDVFHEDCDAFRAEMWEIIKACPHHTFQILTKRPERILKNLPPDWGKEHYGHVWLGTSVGSMKGSYRIAEMVVLTTKVWTGTIFLSAEPLYEHLQTDLIKYFDWVIIGGESGNDTGKWRYRPCDLEWIRSLVNYCQREGVAVFVKQMGTALSKTLGMKDRHGGNIEEFPEDLRIREFPKSISR